MLGKLIVAGLLVGGGFFGYSQLVADEAEGGRDRSGSADRGGGGAEASDGGDGGRPVFIASVERTWDDEGEVYRVRPTRRGRLVAPDELRTAWRQTVDRGVPDRQGLRHQFYCHPLSLVARGKPTWDLEVRRPSVGLSRTMLTGCNPQ